MGDLGSWIERDVASVWHGFTQMDAYAANRPVIVERAEGREVIDVEGNRYLDAISSLWVTTLGHGVPELDQAVRDQLDRVAHTTMLGNGNRIVIELAEALAPRVPVDRPRFLFAAAVIGVHSLYYKLVAFATSSFIGGVSGAILIFTFYRAATPEQFAVNVSIELLAMVIVGGLGSIIGSYFGAAFILLMPGLMNSLIAWLAQLAGASLGVETLAHIPHAVYGALIIVFLLVEPMGLGKMYTNLRNYLLVWPFGYARK